MKQSYLALFLSLILSITVVEAQVVNQIYDHDSTDLSQLHNMPFDETKLLVVSGFWFSPDGIEYHELDQSTSQLIDLTFNDVDTIWSNPEFKDDKMFFEGSINGMGRELVAYDGTSTYFFDFNVGPGDSDPEIIEFENEIYVIASDGAIRQLYKYTGGTSFQQISEEVEDDVDNFVANRGDDYYYITFGALNGRSLKATEDNNGVLTHSFIATFSYQESLGDVVLSNGEIFILSYYFTVIDATYRIDKIDAANLISTHHNQSGSLFSSGHLLAFDNDILFYRSDPGNAEILNVSVAQQPFVQVSLDPTQYNLIGNHVVQNGKLFVYGQDYLLDVSTASNPISIIDDGTSIQIVPAYEANSAFYLYEIAPFASNDPSGIIEVSSVTNQVVRYFVSNTGGFFSYSRPVVENNGEIKFIFKTEDNTPSTDIYSFGSVLDVDENMIGNFDLFPNPSINDHFSIVLSQDGEVKLLTIDGQILRTMNLHAGENTVQVDELSSGVYLVEYNQSVQRLFVD